MPSPIVQFRVGQGIDIHQLVEGRKLILGGVEIAHSHGLLGHSDADVVLHALMDALLGAAGKSDIGTYFPNSDQKWKDASSVDLLKRVFLILQEDNWRVENIDLTILAESPKISSYIERMKLVIAKSLKLDITSCGIKATTAETLGFVGRKEGIYASCVALICR